MTRTDVQAFEGSFNRLLVALKHSFARQSTKERTATIIVYFDSLQEYSLEAVLAAERQFRTQGTSEGAWFPATPEWADAAAAHEVRLAAEQIPPSRRALLPAPDVIAAERLAMEAAREQCLAVCRAKGFEGVARLLAAIPLRHPSEGPQPFCAECADGGLVVNDGVASACRCVDRNPRIRHRHLLLQRRSLIEARRQHAAELTPGRERAIMEGR